MHGVAKPFGSPNRGTTNFHRAVGSGTTRQQEAQKDHLRELADAPARLGR
jgi:hypothetical protein